ncbi:MAG TPA: hypothetical protein VN698_09785 [Bacteroidia bacterium]|nr:hypothetical protein [Bacteroidia bacterium]
MKKAILIIACGAMLGSTVALQANEKKFTSEKNYQVKESPPLSEASIRFELIDTLHEQMYVREVTGHNDGIEVEAYLQFVNAKKGNAWCAAFCSKNLYDVGVAPPINPKTAWAPSFANQQYIVWSPALEKTHKVKAYPMPGDCFTVAYSGTNTVEHVGFITGELSGYFITTEGNTGSIYDQGVHSYKRDKHKIYAVTNYITPYLKTHEKNNSILYFNKPLFELQSKVNTKHAYNYGHNYKNYHNSGLDYNSRYSICSQRSCGENKCNGNSRQKWCDKYAADKIGNGTIGNRCVNIKRPFASELYMQGVRIKMSMARASNKRATSTYRKEERHYTSRSSDKVYTGLA